MPMVPFHERCAEIAFREVRTVKILQQIESLPPDEYAFLEFYCSDEGCDCRRVLLRVLSESQPEKVLATIGFGWESPEFYKNWGGFPGVEKMAGSDLEMGQPQSAYAEDLLELCETMLLSDPLYVARLKRHYQMFKSAKSVPELIPQSSRGKRPDPRRLLRQRLKR
jgi:hypothetical protein